MFTKKFLQLTIAIVFIAAMVAPGSVRADSQVLNVIQGGLTSGPCDSWANACELQYALTSSVTGQEIWVAAGVYKPASGTTRWVSFQLKSGVEIYGGFTGSESNRDQRDWQTNATILSGDIGMSGDTSDNSYHVVTGSGTDSTAVLDGFTIRDGNAINPDMPAHMNNGGGIHNNPGSPTLANLTIINNSAVNGGGISNWSGSNPILMDLTIVENTASYGGGLYNYVSNPILTRVTFSRNTASDYGGGMRNNSSSPMLSDVTFSKNLAIYGGGMANYGDSKPMISGGIWIGNTATDGGGMYNDSSAPILENVAFSGNSALNGGYGGEMFNSRSNPTLTNITFVGNSADEGGNGGGMANQVYSSPTLTNIRFFDNSSHYGGGMWNYYDSNPVLINVTFSGNSAKGNGGGMSNYVSSPTLTNVIFTGNIAGAGGGIFNSSSYPTLTNVSFTGNSANAGGGMYNGSSTPILINSILWNDSAPNPPGRPEFYNDWSTPTISYSIIQGCGGSGSGWDGTCGADGGGNKDTPPLFVDADGVDDIFGTADDNLSLLPESPAINAGNDANCPATDIRGIARPQGTHCDIGAYEYEEPFNQPPEITNITAPSVPIPLGQSVSATVAFNDPDVSDTHDVLWDWGDGSTTETTATVPSVTTAHAYTSAGVYIINATITDAAGEFDTATFQYIVIYDPTGGFVTGGGWIMSPAGAYTANPSLTGKATFGFISKYQKGANVPTGNTEFQFHVANMNFKSTSYDWLVIAGTKAQYKGTGTINGAGEYKFMLTAVDGSPDKFRIKIWNKATNEIIYDNMTGADDGAVPTTVVGGGSIVIHK